MCVVRLLLDLFFLASLPVSSVSLHMVSAVPPLFSASALPIVPPLASVPLSEQ